MLFSGFVFGLMGSFHCVGMCGPIALMLPVDRSNRLRALWQTILYHLGRMTAYALIGLLFGFLGSGFKLFGMQQFLSIAMGVLMLLSVFIPALNFNTFHFSKSLFRWVGRLKSAMAKELKQKRNDTFLSIGFLNGFLPCGLVYMALMGAIAMGNAWTGALYMALFGLGTVPLMSLAVYLGNFLKGRARERLQKIMPIFIVIIAILFILRGLGLGIPFLSPPSMGLETIGANKFC